MTKQNSIQRDILLLLFMFLLLWAGAYLSGVLESLFHEDIDPAAYGLASRYDNYNNPRMSIFLWQGKANSDPNEIEPGFSPTGDKHGNARSFSQKQLKQGTSVDNVGLDHFAETKLELNWFRQPVLTMKNSEGGKIKAVYEYSSYRDPTDPEVIIPSLIWSPDTTRVPEEYHHFIGEGIWGGRMDVHLDWTGVAEEAGGVMVLNVEGAYRLAKGGEAVSFQSLYPNEPDMEGVYRTETKSGLYLYAYSLENENKIIATAHLILNCYTPWCNADGTSLSEEQIDVLCRLGVPSHYGCIVTMDSYDESLKLE